MKTKDNAGDALLFMSSWELVHCYAEIPVENRKCLQKLGRKEELT